MFFVILISLFLGQAHADNTILPQGVIKSDPKFIPPKSATVISKISCDTYDASPIDGLAYMSPSKEYLYVLVKSPRDNRESIQDFSSVYRYKFYRLNILRFEWELMMSFEKGDISVVIPHGKYTDGVSFLTFSEFQDNCYLGNGGGFSTTLDGDYRGVDKQVSSKIFASGRYKILPSSLGRAIADMEKSSILEIDPKTFQSRRGLNFSDGHIPIYLDYESRRLITLNQQTTPIQLELKLENSTSPYKSMPLDTNQKFIRDENQFAKMVYEKNGQRLIIHINQEWTAKKENLYKITLPQRFRAQDVAVYPRFFNDTAVVLGSTTSKRKELRIALVYDLIKNEIVHRHVPQEGYYVSFASMGPDGKFAYFIVNNIRTGAFYKLFQYDLNRKYYRAIRDVVPKDPTPATKKEGAEAPPPAKTAAPEKK